MLESNEAYKISDKIQFVFHKVVIGIIGWLTLSWSITSQREAASSQSSLYSLYGYGAMLIYLWFFHTTNNKSQWKAFGKNTSIISTIITAVTMLVLLFNAGVPKIFIQ